MGNACCSDENKGDASTFNINSSHEREARNVRTNLTTNKVKNSSSDGQDTPSHLIAILVKEMNKLNSMTKNT